jgi:hypothetical protein
LSSASDGVVGVVGVVRSCLERGPLDDLVLRRDRDLFDQPATASNRQLTASKASASV